MGQVVRSTKSDLDVASGINKSGLLADQVGATCATRLPEEITRGWLVIQIRNDEISIDNFQFPLLSHA